MLNVAFGYPWRGGASSQNKTIGLLLCCGHRFSLSKQLSFDFIKFKNTPHCIIHETSAFGTHQPTNFIEVGDNTIL